MKFFRGTRLLLRNVWVGSPYRVALACIQAFPLKSISSRVLELLGHFGKHSMRQTKLCERIFDLRLGSRVAGVVGGGPGGG